MGAQDIKAGGAFVELRVLDRLDEGLKRAANKMKVWSKAVDKQAAAAFKAVDFGGVTRNLSRAGGQFKSSFVSLAAAGAVAGKAFGALGAGALRGLPAAAGLAGRGLRQVPGVDRLSTAAGAQFARFNTELNRRIPELISQMRDLAVPVLNYADRITGRLRQAVATVAAGGRAFTSPIAGGARAIGGPILRGAGLIGRPLGAAALSFGGGVASLGGAAASAIKPLAALAAAGALKVLSLTLRGLAITTTIARVGVRGLAGTLRLAAGAMTGLLGAARTMVTGLRNGAGWLRAAGNWLRGQGFTRGGIAGGGLRLGGGLSLGTVVGGGLASIGAGKLISAGDAYQNVMNRVRSSNEAAAASNEVLMATTEELFNIARRARAPITELAELYSRLALGARGAGIGQRDLLKITEAVSKAATIGGGTQESITGALIQLSQIFGAGGQARGIGQELRSIREQAPVVYKVLAEGLHKVGVSATGSTTEMEKLAEEGVLTSSQIARAILAMADDVETRFARIAPTVSQSLTVLHNQFIRVFGGLMTQSGLSGQIGGIILDISDNLKTMAASLKNVFMTAANWIGKNREIIATVTKIGFVVGAAAIAITGMGLAIRLLAVGAGQIGKVVGIPLSILGMALQGIFAVLGALLTPLGLVAAAMTVLGARSIYASGAVGTATKWMGERFQDLKKIATEAFRGIADALAAGDIQLAASILWTGLKLEFFKGTEDLLNIWSHWKAEFLKTAIEAFYGALKAWARVKAGFQASMMELKGAWKGSTTGFRLAETTSTAVIKGAKGLVEALRLLTHSGHEGMFARWQGWLNQQEGDVKGSLARREMATMEQEFPQFFGEIQRIAGEMKEAIREYASDVAETTKNLGPEAIQAQLDRAKKIADLEAKLKELAAAAKAAREKADRETPHYTIPEGPVGPEMPDMGEVAKQVDRHVGARGIFNALSRQSLLGGDVVDRIADNTKKTADATIDVGKQIRRLSLNTVVFG